MSHRRVIGSEHVRDAQQRGLRSIEVLPGDLVTSEARDTADTLGIKLLEGPIEKPATVKTDGATALRRAMFRRSPKWTAPKASPSPSARKLGKLALVGAGGVGQNVAQLAASADLAGSIALVDVVPGLAAAVALDLTHAAGISRSSTRITGSTDLADVAGADVVVVTAGRPRTPGMTRVDLLDVNRRVVRSVAEAIRARAPKAVVIVVTNPLDEMTMEMLRATGFARNQVIGMAGTLDSSRFRSALALAAGVSPADVEAMTLGSHGEEMVPVASRARIKGLPLEVFLTPEKIEACVKDAVSGGGQVVALRKTGSATIAPALSTIEVIDHIRGARAGVVPVSVRLEGEYGIRDVVLGVACQLGASGVVAVDEVSLTESELAALKRAAAAIAERLKG
jgi:malate dehydrogenase